MTDKEFLKLLDTWSAASDDARARLLDIHRISKKLCQAKRIQRRWMMGDPTPLAVMFRLEQLLRKQADTIQSFRRMVTRNAPPIRKDRK